MKVIHVTNDVAEASGVGTFVRRVNGELLKLGVDSSVVTRPEDLPQPTARSPQRTTVVHVHGMWLGIHHAAAKWARQHGAKLVWSTHGMTAPWSMRHKCLKKLPAWLLYQWRDLLSADLVHSTTDQEVGWNRRFGLKHQCVIPLGTDLPRLKEDDSAVRPPSLRTLLFVGRIYPVKAIDNLIRAFALAVSTPVSNAWALRIVGPDQSGHLAELMALCDKLGLAYSTPDGNVMRQCSTFASTPPQVEFAGPRFGPALAAEYANCTAAALVSHTENFGATIVDAMAHGKPVVAGTKTPWKIVAERGCGWWVDNGPDVLSRAIAELFDCSDAHLHAMGMRGRALAEERYSWGAVGKSMLAEYEKMFKE